MNNKEYLQQIDEAANYIRQQLSNPKELESSIGIVLGSGLGMLGDHIKDHATIISYKTIPHWAQSTAMQIKPKL